MLWRAIEHSILPECQQHEISILAYSPLQQGLLTGRFQHPIEVPEGRRRTRHFSSQSTQYSRHGEPGAEEQTFICIRALSELSKESGCSLIELSLAWLLSKADVASVIVGASSPQQVRANVSSLAVLKQLSRDTLRRCDELTVPLLEILGKNADLWAKVSRIS